MRYCFVSAFIVLVLPCSVLGANRGPSTPEERLRAVTLVHHLEEAPLSSGSKQERQWLMAWLTEVPDVTVSVCTELFRGLLESKSKHRSKLIMQPAFSTAAFVIEHPDKAADEKAKQLAGVEGMLRAYEAILQEEPSARLAVLDDLLAKREAGKLTAFVEETLPKCSAK